MNDCKDFRVPKLRNFIIGATGTLSAKNIKDIFDFVLNAEYSQRTPLVEIDL